MTPLLWALLLLLITVAIIFVEMFVPSGGLLGILSGVTAVSAVLIVFIYEGVGRGLLFLLFSAIILPVVVAAAIKHWPNTPIGRRILNLPPGEEDAITGSPDYEPLQQLVGQTGLARSKMIPSGSISLSGENYDAVSQSGAIEAGQPVRVVAVDGTRILVRAIDPNQAAESQSASGKADPSQQIVEDPFDEPLI